MNNEISHAAQRPTAQNPKLARGGAWQLATRTAVLTLALVCGISAALKAPSPGLARSLPGTFNADFLQAFRELFARCRAEGSLAGTCAFAAGDVQCGLPSAGKVVLRSHVDTCVTDAMATGKAAEREQKIDELMEVFAHYGWLGKRSVA